MKTSRKTDSSIFGINQEKIKLYKNSLKEVSFEW